MKKIVLVLGMMMAMGGASTLYAAESNNAQAIRNGVVEQVTNRMERLLALTDLQAVDVLELNHEYYFLMEGVAPVSMSDREYRRAWNSYERKLRRILSAHQYTLYLSSRGALYAPQPVRTPRVTVVPRPNPTPAPRQMMPQGRGNTQRPMATAPRGNNQPRPNATPQRPNGSNQRPDANNGRTDKQTPNADRGEVNKNNRRPDNNNGRQNEREAPQKQGEI